MSLTLTSYLRIPHYERMAQAQTLTTPTPDETRAVLGLPRTQWRTFTRNGRYQPDEIVALMHEFQDEIRGALDREFRQPVVTLDGVPYLSTIQAARALGIGEFHLSNLRDRGKLTGVPYGRRAIYTRPALEAILNVVPGERFVLANPFMRWALGQDTGD